jgi:hypothetical protein
MVPQPEPRGTAVTLTEKLAAHFQSHPNVWLDGKALEFAGRYAWRSRVSDCRTKLGMNIENRVRVCHFQDEIVPGRSRHFTISEYRFVPLQSVTSAFLCSCAEMTDPPCGFCDGPDRTPSQFGSASVCRPQIDAFNSPT